jgi:hypothetical protein
MKRTLLILCLLAPVATFGPGAQCQTPTARVQEVQTLLTIGTAVDSAMKIAAGLYQHGQITKAQWDNIADIHDNKFLPAYNLAIAAVQADFSSIASPDLVSLASQLITAVQQFQK